MIKKLSKFNCIAFDATFNTNLANFNLKQFFKDHPLDKDMTQKKFKEGKISYSHIFHLESADYHVHSELKVGTTKSTKRINVFVHFCTTKEHKKPKSKTKKIPKQDNFMIFFPWLRKYIYDFSKFNITSNSAYLFNKNKFNPIIKLPSTINIPSVDNLDLGEASISGVNLQFKESKVGIKSVAIYTDENDIAIGIEKCSSQLDDDYFNNTIEFTAKFAKIFIKEQI